MRVVCMLAVAMAAPLAFAGEQDVALRKAIVVGDVSAVRGALERGADPLLGVLRTPLGLAAERGQLACARVLLDHGADPDDGGRLAPLLLACVGKHEALALALLAAGADPDAVDAGGRCALHHAAEQASARLCAALLAAGASDRADSRGQTALSIAQAAKRGALIELLRRVAAPGPAPQGAVQVAAGADLAAAVRAARDGQTLVLAAGRYTGPLLVEKKTLRLIGAPDGGSSLRSDGKLPALTVQGGGRLMLEGVALDDYPSKGVGVVVRKGASLRAIACRFAAAKVRPIEVAGGQLQLEDCRFERCADASVGAFASARLQVRRSRFGPGAKAMIVSTGCRAEVVDCSFEACSKVAVHAVKAAELRLRGCRFAGGVGVEASAVNRVYVDRCAWRQSSSALRLLDCQGVVVRGCQLSDCRFGISLRARRAGLPPALVGNRLRRIGETAISLSLPADGSAWLASNVVVGSRWSMALNGGRFGLGRNRLLAGEGVALSLQNQARARLAGNLLQGRKAALSFSKVEPGQSALHGDLLLGDSTAPARRLDGSRLGVALRLGGRAELERLAEALAGADALEQPLAELERALVALRERAAALKPLELRVEDASGRRIVLDRLRIYDGASDNPGSPAVGASALRQPERLLGRLRQPGDALAKALLARLDASGRELLAAWQPGKPPAAELREALAAALSEAIRGPLLPTDGVELDPEARALRELAGQHEHRLLRLQANRRLLECAFPGALAPMTPLASGRGPHHGPAGRYWLIDADDPRLRLRAELPGRPTLRRPEASWLRFAQGNRGARWLLVDRAPASRLRERLGWIRWAEANHRPDHLRRPGVEPATVAGALALVRARLDELLTPPSKQKPAAKDSWPAQLAALRILAAVGEPQDAARIAEVGGALGFFRCRLWVRAIARIEARRGQLASGQLARMVAADKPGWSLAAAVELHEQGLELGDAQLRRALYLADPQSLEAARAATALLDSGDPRTLHAMRALWQRLTADEAQLAKLRSASDRHASLPALLYLLAYGGADDWRQLGEPTLNAEHLRLLALVADEPLRLVDAMLAMGATEQAPAVGLAFCRLPAAEGQRRFDELLHRVATRKAAQATRRPSRGRPYDNARNVYSLRCSSFMPTSVGIRFYGRFGNVERFEPAYEKQFGMLMPNEHAGVPWFVETRFLDRYVTQWLAKQTAFELQLFHIEPQAIRKAVARIGRGRTPLAYELWMAAHAVGVPGWNGTHRFAAGMEQRSYIWRYPKGGLSGVADLEPRWLDGLLRVRLRLRQEAYYQRSMVDRRPVSAWPHHCYTLDGGRQLIERVSVRAADGRQQVLRERGRDGDWLIFEGQADPAVGWGLDVGLRFLDQRRRLCWSLFSGEGARRRRRLLAAARRADPGERADAQARLAHADALAAAGQVGAAWARYQALAGERPQLLWRGVDLLSGAGQHAAAADALAAAVAARPDALELHAEQVRQRYLAGELAAMVKAADAARARFPDEPTLRYSAALGRLLGGDAAGAAPLLAGLPTDYYPAQVALLQLACQPELAEQEAWRQRVKPLLATAGGAPLAVRLGQAKLVEALGACGSAEARCRLWLAEALRLRALGAAQAEAAAAALRQACALPCPQLAELRLARRILEGEKR